MCENPKIELSATVSRCQQMSTGVAVFFFFLYFPARHAAAWGYTETDVWFLLFA
jgi:hypothetical protein